MTTISCEYLIKSYWDVMLTVLKLKFEAPVKGEERCKSFEGEKLLLKWSSHGK